MNWSDWLKILISIKKRWEWYKQYYINAFLVYILSIYHKPKVYLWGFIKLTLNLTIISILRISSRIINIKFSLIKDFVYCSSIKANGMGILKRFYIRIRNLWNSLEKWTNIISILIVIIILFFLTLFKINILSNFFFWFI